MYRTRDWLVGVAALFCLAPHAFAQAPTPTPSEQPAELSDLSLEELADLSIDSVSGASSYNQKVTEAPSSVTIVTADDIKSYGYRTLADVLRSVRGFYVTYDRNYSFLGVRGFSRPGDYNARVLLLIDGHRLNDNIFGAALVGTEFPLDVDLIDRVEIIRGPSSSLYGTSAFFAVINVITRHADSQGRLEATGSLGSLDTRKGRVTIGHRSPSGPEVLVSASRYVSDGDSRIFFSEFDTPETNNGVAENGDADRFTKLFGTVGYKHFTLQTLYGEREKLIPTASFGTVFNDPRSRTTEMQAFIDLQYNRALPAGWDLRTRGYYDRYAYDGDYVFEDETAAADPFRILNKDFARGNWWGTELKITKRLRPGHIVTAGTEYRDNFRQDQFNYDAAPYQQHLDDRRSSTNWAVYGQDELAIHPKVLLNVGLRHDNYDTFGGTTNPRAGLIYSPLPRSTVKVLYGRAFRAPNAYELYWHQHGIAKANAGLQPERNRTTELVFEQYLGSRLRVAATGFHYGIDGLITQQTDPGDGLLVYNNVDEIRAKGLELEFEGRWPNGLRARLGHTMEATRNRATGLRLTNSPTHLANVNLIAPIWAKIGTGTELQYVGSRLTLAGHEVGGRLLANVTLFREFQSQHLNLSASLYNLFDREYRDPGSEEHRQDAIVQHGRTLRVKLTYRLP